MRDISFQENHALPQHAVSSGPSHPRREQSFAITILNNKKFEIFYPSSVRQTFKPNWSYRRAIPHIAFVIFENDPDNGSYEILRYS